VVDVCAVGFRSRGYRLANGKFPEHQSRIDGPGEKSTE